MRFVRENAVQEIYQCTHCHHYSYAFRGGGHLDVCSHEATHVSDEEQELYDITREVKIQVEDSIEDIFSEIHGSFETKSGDISPEEHFKLNTIKKDLIELIAKQVYNNLPKK